MMNGRCILPIVADVIATVADGIATFVGMFKLWQMLLPLLHMEKLLSVGMYHCARCHCDCCKWNSHWVNV